ncbi:MAG: hypothetical protein ACRDWI_08805 [Jiangellaceae bacterium]
MDDHPETLARGDGVLGEVVLRRRPGPVYELIVGGVFLMDTAETSTERLLADVVLDRHPAPRRVLVGGLGLGVTVTAMVADVRVERVDVVEIEPLLVSWLRAGMVPGVAAVLDDPRLHVQVADVRDVLRATAEQVYDAVLLDVDNGPGFLVHPDNAAVYRPRALRQAGRLLAPDGLLAVWSAAPSADLPAAILETVGPCDEVVRTVRREGRALDYHVYLAKRRTT